MNLSDFNTLGNPESPHVMVCEPAIPDVPAPKQNCTLATCEFCDQAIWLGPNHRTVIAELEVIRRPFQLACIACHNAGKVDPGRPHMHVQAHEAADILRFKRGVEPQSSFLVVRAEDLVNIRRDFGLLLGIDITFRNN